MKIFTLLTFFLALFATPFLSAQRNCAAMEYLEQQLLEDPARMLNMEQIEEQTQRFLADPQDGRVVVVTIPVVVNVVYNTSAENVSYAQIQSQIDVLNEDFRRMNSDADNVWSQAADTEIEFCLATVDPAGNATDGIRRQSTSKRAFQTNDDVKKSSRGGIDPWPTDQYMNIWVCDIAGGILGYAQFPGGDPATDGIVCDYAYFGTTGTATFPFHLGRTATHEVGHYLNLRHIWGDGGCSVDDFVSDTPLSDGANYGCAIGTVSCSSVDMVQNYMDYSDDACMNLFTQGQSGRMQALFAPGGARYTLTTSSGCGDGGGDPNPTCDDGIQNGDETGIDCGGTVCAACPPPATCEAPTNLSSSPKARGKRALLEWDAVSGATSYTLEIRQIAPSTGSWNTFTASGNSLEISGLTAGNTYEWRVASNCQGSSSLFSTSTFVAGQNGRQSGAPDELLVFPNPAKDKVTLMFSDLAISQTITLAEKPVTHQLQVADMYGRVLLKQRVSEEDYIEVDVSTLAQGVYIIRLMDEQGRELGSTKFVVQH